MWEADPATLITLAVMVAAYVVAAIALKCRPLDKQVIAFGGALIAMLAVLAGPLDRFTKERSFATYIFQQMVLVFVVPPLLLLGLPDWMARPVLLNRYVEPLARTITTPLFAFLLFSGVFTLIHYPPVCDRVCHVGEFDRGLRAILVLTGTILWWPLVSPLPEYPRMSYPMQILYLFLLMIPMTAVGAPITMAPSVLYVFYAAGGHPFGLTPMADQVLGGLIMWVGQGVYIMFVFSGIFFRWAREEDQEMPPINRQGVARESAASLHFLCTQDRPSP
jgi:putative membrane protein